MTTDAAFAAPDRDDQRSRWLRICIGCALIAVVAGFTLIPVRNADPHDPVDQATLGLKQVLLAITTYSSAHDGRLPIPSQIAPTLIAHGSATTDTFRLKDALPSDTSFYFVLPQATQGREPQPVAYTNPRLRKDRRIAVAFSDNHIEWLSPIQSQAFLSSIATRAFPLK